MKNQFPHNQILGNNIATSQILKVGRIEWSFPRSITPARATSIVFQTIPLNYSHKSDITDILRLGVRTDTDNLWTKIESLQWVLFVIFVIRSSKMVVTLCCYFILLCFWEVLQF